MERTDAARHLESLQADKMGAAREKWAGIIYDLLHDLLLDLTPMDETDKDVPHELINHASTTIDIVLALMLPLLSPAQFERTANHDTVEPDWYGVSPLMLLRLRPEDCVVLVPVKREEPRSGLQNQKNESP